ncbi:universal stress protein [Streptacidiphilus rugosus]|uniref:universal stress protein n=1 Tax=Streptacidiphilus rugosus TaxID=405783 RepID=UPI00055F479E|nr:universal stress protein [Streptacidiphilus rugosus]
MFQRILLALDSSPARRRTLDTAASLASLSGGTVHVLHVDASVAAGVAVLPLEEDAAAHGVLAEALNTLRDAGVPAEGELLQGLTIEIPGLISAAVDRLGADLLVLGPHHRGAFAGLLNPRVSDAVNHAVRIPLLLVPDADQAA